MRYRMITLLTLAALLSVNLLGALAAEPIKLMVPANPGGGWDSTGRSVLAALEAEGIHKAGAQVTNKGGAGGTIGLAEFVSTMKGNDNAMMVMGVIMVGGILTNKSPVTLEQVTPLARLTIEYNAIAVAPSSPFKTVKDLTDALKADPGQGRGRRRVGGRRRPHHARAHRPGGRRARREAQLRRLPGRGRDDRGRRRGQARRGDLGRIGVQAVRRHGAAAPLGGDVRGAPAGRERADAQGVRGQRGRSATGAAWSGLPA